MNDEIAKVCPYCAEQVNKTAKICPRCRQWLSVLSLRNPAVFMAVFYFCVLIFTVGLLCFIQRLFNPGADFSPYRNDISIVESRMNLSTAGKDPMVYLIVLVTNKTDMAWKGIQFDARFFDKSGTLIDACEYPVSYSVIPPHTESALRIRNIPSHPLSDYESYKIYIGSARDAHSRLY